MILVEGISYGKAMISVGLIDPSYAVCSSSLKPYHVSTLMIVQALQHNVELLVLEKIDTHLVC